MISTNFLVVNLCLLMGLAFVNGQPTGAPTAACADMSPNHLNYVAQTSSSPFRTVPTQVRICNVQFDSQLFQLNVT